MRIAFLCPNCEELVVGDYTPDSLDVTEGCHCSDNLMKWGMSLLMQWDDVIIMNLNNYKELRNNEVGKTICKFD